MDIQGSVTVVTGASSGLGLALSEILGQRGATIVMSGRSEPSLQKHAVRLGALAIAADVTDETAVADLGSATVRRYGRIDAWINNAGVWMPYTPFQDVPDERARHIMETNYLGVWHGSQVAYRQMLKQGHGTILNILSIRVREPVAYTVAYSSSKLAAYGLTQVLRAEAAPHNIRVLAALPGRIQTHLFDERIPQDYANFMDPRAVASAIASWMSQSAPDPELVITQDTLGGESE
ncbi:MAG: SDR family oxidoreductase [Candidatus Kerfeldbacteria bacterium]|nr:SDR family oxidoreductase [Candidatus Kerfeldbacteria bacterium]